MDEPTSALDPISTAKVEELALELKKDYTIVMVTDNMQQAARISDRTAFFLLGEIVEFGKTEQIFSMPKDKRTEDYITGRFATMKTKFDEQLEEMHVELIKMGSLCEQAITLSSRALLGDEKSQVEQVYSVDGEIDQQEREIENICMRLLLLQRPFASDLRKISAALKMISDMERIGDQASDIADMVPYIRFSEAKSKVHIEAMAKATVKMVTDSVDAFVQDDLDLAQRVIDSDDEVDDLFNRVKNELIDLIYAKDIDAKVALDLLMTAKYYERIGDHAVNIAEWVVYSITGVHKSNE